MFPFFVLSFACLLQLASFLARFLASVCLLSSMLCLDCLLRLLASGFVDFCGWVLWVLANLTVLVVLVVLRMVAAVLLVAAEPVAVVTASSRSIGVAAVLVFSEC